MRRVSWFVVLASASALACGSAPEPEGEAARLEARLDRASVHFHLTLRESLDGSNGAETARRLEAARTSSEVADRLARELFEGRDAGERKLRGGGRASRAIAGRLVDDPTLDPESDRAAFFLALAAQEAQDDRRVPKQILVYEASRLRPSRVSEPVLRAFARAVAALTFARAGYCDRSRIEADGVGTVDDATIDAALDRWIAGAAVDRDRARDDLRRALTVLVGGARACCAIRRGHDSAAARSVSSWVDDAEQLEVDPQRVAILRAWRALVEGDRDAAREQLGAVTPGTLSSGDAARFRLVRDSLASPSDDGMEDARARLVDRRWISELVLTGAFAALEADGTVGAIRAHPEADALRRVAAGEAAVIEAARERYPMFDQSHGESKGTWDRLAELFD